MAKLGITNKELELLESLEFTRGISEASDQLNITEETARQRLYRLKMRYNNAQNFIKEYNRWMGRLPVKYLE